MRKAVILISLLLPSALLFGQQKLKYKTDIEPLFKQGFSKVSITKCESYYKQGMGPTGKPTSLTLSSFREQYVSVCKFMGKNYEQVARSYAKYPTFDTAVKLMDNSLAWYNHIVGDLFIKSDTLPKYIAKLQAQRDAWSKENSRMVEKILVMRDTLSFLLYRVADLDSKKAMELNEKYKNVSLPAEYEKCISESSQILDNLTKQKQSKDEQVKAALEYKQAQLQQAEKEGKQKDFLQLQQQCTVENPCPNCPLDVAKAFRDAYFAGDVDKMKGLIVDYFGNQTLFYNNDLNMYRDLTPDENKKLSLQLKARTSDYKRTNPENVVFYTDNEKKTFFIDKNYRGQLLHATVFKAVNEYDKIDLVKWKGEWKVYRVGGNYAGRSGKSIVNGKFFVDPKLLKAEE